MSESLSESRRSAGDFAAFALAARSELLALLPAGGARGLSGEVCQTVAARGATVRLLREPGANELRVARPTTAELRCLPRVPQALVLVDRRAALLTPRRTGMTIAVHQPALVDALWALFASLWHQARPAAPSPAPTAPGRRDPDVLEMLARGATDGSAAATLGVSIRTYRRWVADLMVRLGATSRFQAGVHAARGGWCDAPPVTPLVTMPEPRRPAGAGSRSRTNATSASPGAEPRTF